MTGTGYGGAGSAGGATRRSEATVAPSSRWWALVLVPLTMTVPAPASAQEPAVLCARFGDVVEVGAVAAAELLEISGMVSSRIHSGVVYAHNDAGDSGTVFAMDETGRDLGPYTVGGTEPIDWEDIAVGPLPGSGRPALYLGDIGDNRARRSTIQVVRVPEPEVMPDGGGGQLGQSEVFRLDYPDGAADAEALIVDPRSGDLVIVTSPADGAPRIYSATSEQLVEGSTITLTAQGAISSLRGSKVNAADISPDGSFILLRTPDSVLAFERGDEPIGETLSTTPCRAPAPDEPAPQAIAIVGDGSGYITASEVAGAIDRGDLPPGSASRLYRVSIAEPGEVAPTTTAPASTTTAAAPATTGTPPTTEIPPTTETRPTTDTAAPDTAAPDSSVPDTAVPDTMGPGESAPPDGSTATEGTPAPGDEDGAVGTDDDSSGDGGGLPLWRILVAVAAIAGAIAAVVVVRRRNNTPLPGSAPLPPDPFAPAPTEELPVTPPPPPTTPGALPPPDPGGRLG